MPPPPHLEGISGSLTQMKSVRCFGQTETRVERERNWHGLPAEDGSCHQLCKGRMEAGQKLVEHRIGLRQGCRAQYTYCISWRAGSVAMEGRPGGVVGQAPCACSFPLTRSLRTMRECAVCTVGCVSATMPGQVRTLPD
jgi:hypothetical protein